MPVSLGHGTATASYRSGDLTAIIYGFAAWRIPIATE